MSMMSFISKVVEKSAEFRLNIAYQKSKAAMSVFVKSRNLLNEANENLVKTRVEVQQQMLRLSKITDSVSDEIDRNDKFVAKINSILE